MKAMDPQHKDQYTGRLYKDQYTGRLYKYTSNGGLNLFLASVRGLMASNKRFNSWKQILPVRRP